MNDSNQENNDDRNNGLNFGPDILEALLRVSQSTTDTEDFDSMEAISGEYSSLNKTMDELNSFMDRWEERHDRLRGEIHEVLSERSQESQQIVGASEVCEQYTNTQGSSVEGASNNNAATSSTKEQSELSISSTGSNCSNVSNSSDSKSEKEDKGDNEPS